jgi:hypothetical protein
VQVDPEEILRPSSEARLNHSAESHVLNGLPCKRIVHANQCYAGLARPNHKIGREVSLDNRGLETSSLRPFCHCARLLSAKHVRLVSIDVLRFEWVTISVSWRTKRRAL